MRTLITIAAAVALTACSTPPTELGTMQLCERYLWGSSNRAALADEVKSRGVNCEQYAEQIQPERAAKQAKRDQALRDLAANPLLQQKPAQTFNPTFPQPVHCRSRNVYGTIYTDCN